ncbi:Heat shock 70 kDa protein cognate 2 [Taenia solium]|eukprot:TsM_001073400 transcript=TsM_001073400 gene=TsM_001073400
MPSYVTSKETQYLIGAVAENEVTFSFNNTVLNTKRLTGHRFHGKTVYEDVTLCTFEVTNFRG